MPMRRYGVLRWKLSFIKVKRLKTIFFHGPLCCYYNILSCSFSSFDIVLYIRRVYPQESFCPTSFLGLRCHANRHPQVVDYITQTTSVALSTVAAGESQEIAIVLYDQYTAEDHEIYRLHFDEQLVVGLGGKRAELEREVRNMILSLLSLEGLKTPHWSAETTFRIMVQVNSKVQSCAALKNALSEGKWFFPGDAMSQPSRRRRPVHQMVGFGCRFYVELESADSVYTNRK